MTYRQIVNELENQGANLAEVAIGRMMDIVEEETGRFPDWNEQAPEWIIETAKVKGGAA